jgi:hypothetical protein
MLPSPAQRALHPALEADSSGKLSVLTSNALVAGVVSVVPYVAGSPLQSHILYRQPEVTVSFPRKRPF